MKNANPATVIARVSQALVEAGDDLVLRDQLVRELESLQKQRERAEGKSTSGKGASPAVPSPLPDKTLRHARPAPRLPSANGLTVTWGDDWRGIPNELARTGLFNIKQAEPRRWFDNEPIATLRNTTMYFSGPELRVRDEDVLLQCFHFQRNTPWGDPWCVNGRDFLLSMHWSDGRRGYVDLYESLLRLSKGHVSIMRKAPGDETAPPALEADDDRAFVLKAGSLIEIEIAHGARGSSSIITVALNKRTLALWRTMGYTLVNWDQRLALTSPLARFLHRFYSSHREPYALKVETLLRLTGSSTASVSKFRQLLRGALQSLVDVGFLSAYWTDSSDLVHVRRILIAPLSLPAR